MMAKRRRGGRRVAQRVELTWYGDDFLATVERYGDDALFAAGEVVQREAEQRAPRGRTGNLRRSGYVSTATRSSYVSRRYWRREKKPPKGGATIGFTAPHAHLVEGGRKRRAGKFGPRGDVRYQGTLRRTGKKALRIGDQLRARARRSAMSARPFLAPALEAARETMMRELAGVLRKRLEQMP